MRDPSVALQAAINTALRTDPPLLAILGGPYIFNRPPQRRGLPYITLGEAEVSDDSDDCHDGAESIVTVHIWTEDATVQGQVSAKSIAAAVVLVLDAPIPIEGHNVVVHEIESIRHLPGTADLTPHSIVTVRYQTTPAV